MAYTINALELGIVHKEEFSPSSDLDVMGFPASGSKDTEAYDCGGVTRKITVTGTLTGTSVQDLMDKCMRIDALQNGDQTTVIYHSDAADESTYTTGTFNYTSGNFYVKVESFRYSYIGGQPLKVEYTLELVESI